MRRGVRRRGGQGEPGPGGSPAAPRDCVLRLGGRGATGADRPVEQPARPGDTGEMDQPRPDELDGRQPLAEDHGRDDRRGQRGQQQRGRRPPGRDASDAGHQQEVRRRARPERDREQGDDRRWFRVRGDQRARRPEPFDGQKDRTPADEVRDGDQRPVEGIPPTPAPGQHDVQPEHDRGGAAHRDAEQVRAVGVEAGEQGRADDRQHEPDATAAGRTRSPRIGTAKSAAATA